MTQASFEKISDSDKIMYGPRKLLVCGFSPAVHSKFKIVLEYAGMIDIPVIWVSSGHSYTCVAELLKLPDGTGWELPSELPRAVIVSGVTQGELHKLMAVSRKTGMKQPIWAALTPTSETWTITELLRELNAERAMFEKKTFE